MKIDKEFINNNQTVIDNYLEDLKHHLSSAQRYQFKHERNWSNSIEVPTNEGVYGIFDKEGLLCYVGESACLFKRMKDMYDSRNHNIRRAIAEQEFSKNVGYIKPSSHTKADDNTEALVTNFMEEFEISWIEVKLGRTELEEYIIDKVKPKYNTKTKRSSEKKIK